MLESSNRSQPIDSGPLVSPALGKAEPLIAFDDAGAIVIRKLRLTRPFQRPTRRFFKGAPASLARPDHD